ncbi:MAG: hypothetical protein ACR2FS_15030 [Phormidesmis sp.]
MGADLMPFADNWAYLKTELSWLDRLLMLAIARQRKETKAINKIAQTSADRVSSHWWKGVISVSKPAYDDCRVPTQTKRSPASYQQQLESRIAVSAKGEVVLALPSLRHYLNLTLFEKNLILLALAPEVNRRYGRLYHYLQTGEDKATVSDLPTVDLALRLLCRNDLERRRARASLTTSESLVERRILRYVSPRPSTRLSSYLQLTDDWVNYLLAEQPDQRVLFERLATVSPEPVLALPAPTAATRAVQICQPEVSWDQLILPAPLLTQLQTLGQRASVGLTRSAAMTAPPPSKSQVALLIGAAGTGKTMAAGAIATSLRQPLGVVDLKQVHPDDWPAVLAALDSERYPVLLIKSAFVWFGRNSPFSNDFSEAHLTQWLQQRQANPGLTLLSAHYLHTVKARWRQQMDAVLTLPMPNRAERKILWRQAFAGIICSPEIDWIGLAKQLKISGGEIRVLAQAAVAIAQSKNAETVTLGHIQQVIEQRSK